MCCALLSFLACSISRYTCVYQITFYARQYIFRQHPLILMRAKRFLSSVPSFLPSFLLSSLPFLSWAFPTAPRRSSPLLYIPYQQINAVKKKHARCLLNNICLYVCMYVHTYTPTNKLLIASKIIPLPRTDGVQTNAERRVRLVCLYGNSSTGCLFPFRVLPILVVCAHCTFFFFFCSSHSLSSHIFFFFLSLPSNS